MSILKCIFLGPPPESFWSHWGLQACIVTLETEGDLGFEIDTTDFLGANLPVCARNFKNRSFDLLIHSSRNFPQDVCKDLSTRIITYLYYQNTRGNQNAHQKKNG